MFTKIKKMLKDEKPEKPMSIWGEWNTRENFETKLLHGGDYKLSCKNKKRLNDPRKFKTDKVECYWCPDCGCGFFVRY